MSATTDPSTGSSRRVRREVARLDKFYRRNFGALVERFGEEQATVVRAEILEEYRGLIPEVPYIGGRRNMYTPLLMSAGAQALATYRVILRHGGTVEDTGELFHHMQRAELDRIPRVVRHWMGRHLFMGKTRRQLQHNARRSQARRYPGDNVTSWVDGDGKSFDWGADTTECSIVKYHHAHGADELTPYVCELDYVVAEKMGYELWRTKTLSWGCDGCDHRFVLGRSTTASWPPAFVERSCGRRDTARPESAPAQ